MIEDGVIIDTSLWIEYFRGSSRSSSVEALIRADRAATTGLILAELLQGVKNENEEDQIVDVFGGLRNVEITNHLWKVAGKTAAALRRKGVTLPLSDIAISALALERQFSLFTLDKHFEKIPKLKFYHPP